MPSPSIELAAILMVAGLCLFFLELFIPSAGTLFAIALVCVASSIVIAFLTSTTAGFIFLATDLVLALVLPGIGLKIWQRTPLGRRMFLDQPGSREQADTENPGAESDYDFQPRVVPGQIGRTITPLRPAGTTDFDGRRVDSVSEGVMIERGKKVRVVSVEGRRIVVRELE